MQAFDPALKMPEKIRIKRICMASGGTDEGPIKFSSPTYKRFALNLLVGDIKSPERIGALCYLIAVILNKTLLFCRSDGDLY